MTTANPSTAARDLRIEAWNIDMKIPFPVDPFTIAKDLGISVFVEPLEPGVAGFIVKDGDDSPVEIYVNADDSATRQRFTVAHELGHFVRNRQSAKIGYVDKRDDLASRGSDPVEVWSNRFAADLLMPSAVVLKNWAEGWTAEELRRKFDVSAQAMNHRLSNLGLV